MTRMSFMPRVRMALTGGLIFAAIATSEGTVADAAEVKVLTSVALTSALDELAPQIERATGNKLTIGYGLISDIRKRILEGESADVIILSRPVMDELQKQDKVAVGPITNVVGTAVSVAARAGAPKPDMSSVDAFKRSPLAAKSIVYAYLAKGGASGVYFASVLDRLGIAEQMKPKTILVPGLPRPPISSRRAKPSSASPRLQRSCPWRARKEGPLPGEYARVTVFSAGIGVTQSRRQTRRSPFIQFLTGPTAAPVFKSKGFEPG